MSNKTTNKKSIWIVPVVVAIACSIICGIFMMVYYDSGAKSEMHKTEKRYNGVIETSPLENRLTIKHDGTYVIIADWGSMGADMPNGVPEDGFLTGVAVLNEEKEVLFSCTGARVHAESMAVELKKGDYVFVLETLATEEQFQAFCKMYGCEEQFGSSFDFTSGDGIWPMRYVIEIVPKNGNVGPAAAILCGLFFGIAMTIVLRVITTDSGTLTCEYDERQIAARGKAFRYGFWTALVYLGCVALLHMITVQIPMEEYLVDFIGILIALCVMLTVCIWEDAYFALNENRGKLMVIFAAVSVLNLLAVLMNFSLGLVIVNGRLSLGSVNIFCLVMVVYVFVNLWLKDARDRKEDAE